MYVALAVLILLGVAAAVAWKRFRPRPLFKLTLREEGGAGLEFVIRDRVATIGTEEGQSIVVSHPKVSRNHAEVEMQPDGSFVIRDRSKFGVRVNGEPVKEAPLHSGDLIRLGDSIDLIFTRL